MRYKTNEKLQTASRGYLEFLALGGQLRFTDLTRRLIREYLGRSIPILTGLSATYLYRSMREYGPERRARRYPRRARRPFRRALRIRIRPSARCWSPIPCCRTRSPTRITMKIDVDRVICAILLGILTYDANLLIIRAAPQAH